MARIRTIKPEFFTSEDVSALPLRARLTWIGLWTQCDDHGRTKDVGKLVKATVWPLDEVGLKDVEEDLVALAEAGLIVRYEVAGRRYLAVVNWHSHQKIQKPSKARHPHPPRRFVPTDPEGEGFCHHCYIDAHAGVPMTSGIPTGDLPESDDREAVALSLGKERKGKEGTRGVTTDSVVQEASPDDPTRCPSHQSHPNPPACGACGDARRRHAAKPTLVPSQPECPIHPGNPSGSKTCPECAREAAPAPNLRALRDRKAI